MAQKVIPDKEVERLIRLGLNNQQVADYLGEHHKIHVTFKAISIWRRRAGMPRLRPASPPDLIPWKVKPEHRFKQPLAMLRNEAKVRRGETLRPETETAYRNWRAKLAENNWVIVYDPESPAGFDYAQREDGDLELIRMPPEGVTAPQPAAGRGLDQDTELAL